MGKSCWEWVENMDTTVLLKLANDWGMDIACQAADGYTEKLQTFEEYLMRYYGTYILPGLEEKAYATQKENK